MVLPLESFEKALRSLALALEAPKTDLTRDATIQRFEFCVELAWKTSKRMMGTASTAPRAVVRDMAAQNLIDAPAIWFAFLEGRNLSSHTYREEIAEKVFALAGVFLPEGQSLLERLKTL